MKVFSLFSAFLLPMLASGVLEGQIVIPDEVLQELAAQGFSLNSTNSIDSTFTSSTGGTSRGGLTPVGGSKSVKGSKGGKGGLARKWEEVGLGFQVFIGVGDLPLWDIPTDTWVGNLTEVQTLMPGGPESPACQVSGAITLFPDSYNEPVEQITFQGGTCAIFGGLTYNVLTGGSGMYVGAAGTIGATDFVEDAVDDYIVITITVC